MKKIYKDKIFGILNRTGFERKVSKKDADFIVYLLDFIKIGEMNSSIGYLKTNKRFKRAFKSLKKEKFILGRCFFGDEILIAIDTNNKHFPEELNIIKEKCKEFGLNFRQVNYIHYNEEKIRKTIKKLIKKLEKYK